MRERREINPLLEIEGLEVWYGNTRVVHGIDLTVDKGELIAIVGSNGAGKTSTLRAISNVIQRSLREMTFDGERVERRASHELVQRGLAHVPEGRHVFPFMTVVENLVLAFRVSQSRRLSQNEALERVFELFPRLAERREQLAGTLSGGEQQMLAIGRAVITEPRVVMLDEPSMGLAPSVVDTLVDSIEELRSGDVGVILVEQNAQIALELSNRTYVMRSGNVIREAPSKELLNSGELEQIYLGGGTTNGT